MTAQVEFFNDITYQSVNPLLDFVAAQMAAGEREFLIAMSSPGGNVFAGLTAYNFLKGCGARIVTHNIGHVHSIAGPLFCAGDTRKCVPTGRFLIHDVTWGMGQGSYSEIQLREALEGLKGDRTSIAQVLAETMREDLGSVEATMREALTFHASEAVTRGLATEVSTSVFDAALPITRLHA